MRSDEIWILGATGRSGRAVAQRIERASELPLVLVGRNPSGLADAASALERPARTLALPTYQAMAEAVRAEQPRVVVNALGSYSESAPLIARACLPGGHYVDIANDTATMSALRELHVDAVAGGSTFVTGAGFGVLATEAIVAKLCAGGPVPASVQVDAIASVAGEPGLLGEALAGVVIDVLLAGGMRFRNGHLVPAPLASPVRHLTAPDGSSLTSAGVASGELMAAQWVSGAPEVVATSGLAPTSRAIRAVLPVAGATMRIPALRRAAVRRMAAIRTKETPRPRPHSWGHAVVEWSDGRRREGWLRADDAMEFTTAVLATVTERLANGAGPAGAYTPAAALGAEVAEAAGGVFVLD
jgi:short subunit dehydrogenase-like uncharacterized protein